jgi:two-component system CheB/CheR fusion protein
MNRWDRQPPVRVLVADDCPDTRDSLALLLRLWGFRVAQAEDGLAALSLAASFRPDVALLDLAMPGLDGYEVARRLRSEPGLSGMLLVAVSGHGRREDRDRALAAGFDCHLTKPLEPRQLRLLLDGCAVPGLA